MMLDLGRTVQPELTDVLVIRLAPTCGWGKGG